MEVLYADKNMIERILPCEVVSADVRGDDPSASLFPEEAALVSGAIDKRVREFTIGRTCAHRALDNLGLPSAPILRGPKREPLWPPGVVGSITHCEGYCAAAVAKQHDMLTVAIDAEVHDVLPPGVLKQVCRAEELEWLAGAPQNFSPNIHWDRLIFSAKESVYKAWFPLTRRWLNFEDVRVTFEPTAGVFQAHLLVTPPTITDQKLTAFSGYFLVRNGLVITAITLPRC